MSAIDDPSFDLTILNENSTSLDHLPEKIFLHWKKICYLLENYSTELIQNDYVPLQNTYTNFNLHLLKTFISRLQFMYVPDIVWKKYTKFRGFYLENYQCPCSIQGSCFSCCLKTTVQCINEDVYLASIGCFHPYTVIQSNAFEVYFEIIDRKFYKVLQILDNCFTVRRNLPEEIVCILKPYSSAHINACFNCFLQNQTSIEVESAVYCIQNNYGIASVWNTVSISCTIRIIENILLFEDRINFILHKNHSTYHTHEENLLPWIEGKLYFITLFMILKLVYLFAKLYDS